MKTSPLLFFLVGTLGCRSLFAAVGPPSPSQEPAELAARYEAMSAPQFIQGQKLISLLRIERGASVLDLGCGTGKLAEHVAKLVGPEGRVLGLDPSPARIGIAKKRETKVLSFAVGSSDDLASFAPASFDRVYLNYVFHWIDKKAEALRQIDRILKPGGRVGITTGSRDQPSEVRKVLLESVREALGEIPPGLFLSPFRTTPQELRGLAEQAGFRILELQVLPLSDYMPDPDSVIRFLEASSSGKVFSGVDEEKRARIVAIFKKNLTKLQTPRGIEMDHPVLLFVGEKPS